MRRRIIFQIALSFILCFAIACSPQRPAPWIGDHFMEQSPPGLVSEVQYASGFDLFHWNGITRLVVYQPGSDRLVAGEFYLAEEEITGKFRDTVAMIPLPLKDVAVFSSTQLSAFSKLKALDMITGVSEAAYIINPAVRERLKNKTITELAGSGNYFIERTLEVHPSLIFLSPYLADDSRVLAKTGIPLVPFYDFYETDPLGRAEWIRFTAAFCGREAMADSIFREIEERYRYFSGLASSAEGRPSVFSDKYFNGQWYIPGGESYIAQLFHDAGADYLWKDDSHRASFPLDYETVFERAHDADYWRIIGSYGDEATYAGLLKENELYGHFKAFRQRQVIYCDAKETAYFENSPLEPERVLADLIKAFHPGLLPEYEPKYYRILP